MECLLAHCFAFGNPPSFIPLTVGEDDKPLCPTELDRKRLINITAARNYQLVKSDTELKTNMLTLFMGNICPQCLLRHDFFPFSPFSLASYPGFWKSVYF